MIILTDSVSFRKLAAMVSDINANHAQLYIRSSSNSNERYRVTNYRDEGFSFILESTSMERDRCMIYDARCIDNNIIIEDVATPLKNRPIGTWIVEIYYNTPEVDSH